MGAVASIAAVVGTVVSTGLAAAQAAGAFGTPGAGTKPVTGVDPSQVLRGMLPGAKADAAARAGGGISPEFLAGLAGQESGMPGQGLSILGDIRSSLGGIQGP